MIRPTLSRAAALCLTIFLVGPLASAQEAGDEADPEPHDPDAIEDPYDTTAPVGAVRAYIDAARDNRWAAAATHLNVEGANIGRAEELARQLKIVLDRTLWIDYDRISKLRSGRLDDGLPPNLELIGSIGEAEVLLERMPEIDGERPWKFSTGTVNRVPELYAIYGYGMLDELLPRWMFDTSVFEMQLWQWIGIVLLVVAAWILSWAVVRLLHVVGRPLAARSETNVDDRLVRLVDEPARLLVAVLLFGFGSLFMQLSVRANGMVASAVKALSVVAVAWLALRLVDFLAEWSRDRLEHSEHSTAVAIVPLGRRAVKVVLVAVALVAVLQNMGFEVTGLIAGLGVGGLAFALAAQKTIENLFGGVSLIADQPVRVGDFCRFGANVGTVEEIGMRSTRIRTLDRTRITVPNSQFSEIHLENFAARDRVRLVTTIGVRYETSPDQMRYVLTGLRRVLVEHPKVVESPARVRFVGFGSSSLDIEVYTYVTTTDWAEFLAIREDLFLRFMDVIAAAGTGFAFPSQTLYMAKDAGLNAARTAEGVRQVEQWRERGELPFPEFDPATLDGLRGTGDWPPAGSVGAAPDSGRGTEEEA